MQPPSSKEVISRLLAEGWYLARVRGDHHQFKHPARKGTVTVQHPVKTLGWIAWSGIQKQAGWK